MINGNKIFSDTLLNAIFKLLSVCLTFFTISIIIKILGLEEYGIFVLLSTFFIHANFFEFGLGAYITKEVSKNNTNSIDYLNKVFNTNLFIAFIFSLSIVLIFTFSVKELFHFFKIPVSKENIYGFYSLSISFLFTMITSIYLRVLQGFHRYKELQISGIIQKISILIFLMIFYVDLSILKLGLSYLFSSIFTFLFVYYKVKYNFKISVNLKYISLKIFKDSFQFNSTLLLGKLVSFFQLKVNYYLVAYILGVKYVAILDIVIKIWQIPVLIYTILTYTSLSYSSSIESHQGIEKLKEYFLRYNQLIIFIMMFVNINLIVNYSDFVQIWIGTDIDTKQIGFMLVPLLISNLILSYYGLLYEMSIGLDLYKYFIKKQIIITIILIPFTIFLIKNIDVLGVNLLLPIFSFLMGYYYLIYFIDFLKIKLATIVIEYLKYSFLGVVLFLLLNFINYFEYALAQKILLVLFINTIYFIFVYLLLDEKNKHFIMKKLRIKI